MPYQHAQILWLETTFSVGGGVMLPSSLPSPKSPLYHPLRPPHKAPNGSSGLVIGELQDSEAFFTVFIANLFAQKLWKCSAGPMEF